MEEIWKDIAGYEGLYQISNKGRVKSLNRLVKDTTRDRVQKIKGRILKYCDNGKGYKLVYLNKNRKRKNYYVHRLVAETFIPNPRQLPEVNHKDLNKANNKISNLEWITELDNKRHYRMTEIAKIRNKEIGEIRREAYKKQIEKVIPRIIFEYSKNNKTLKQINIDTGIGVATISKILKQNGIKINHKKRKPYKIYRDRKGKFTKLESDNK